MENKTLIYCINKNVNKHGVTKSFILKDNAGNVIEASRQQVLEMFRNPNMKFVNLKLSSDGKILYSSPEDSVNRGFDSKKNSETTTVDIHMLNSLLMNECMSDEEFFNDLKANINKDVDNREEQRDTFKSYVMDFASDMDASDDYALRMLSKLRNKSNTIQLVAFYKSKGLVVGYKIKNVGNEPITYVEGKYYLKNGHVYTESCIEKQLMPGQTVTLNKVDGAKLIMKEEYCGKFANCQLSMSGVPKIIITVEDILARYNIVNTSGTRLEHLDGEALKFKSITDKTASDGTRQALKDAKGLKGVMDAFKR